MLATYFSLSTSWETISFQISTFNFRLFFIHLIFRVETREERVERRKKEKAEQVAYKLEQEIALWDPNSIGRATEDPFKTLFIARINYYTSESKLRYEIVCCWKS